jgi:hypothetical protein
MTMPIRRATTALAACVIATAGLTPASASQACTDAADGVAALPDLAAVTGATGTYALPAEAPTAIAVFMHGYGHLSDPSWVEHMRRTASHGAIAFGTDYRGHYVDGDGAKRGWFVREGAEEAIAYAKYFLAGCGGDLPVYVYGVSMGGNSSGLAVAAGATRAGGVPLFDYWVAGEPAANVIETYLTATAVGPAVPFAAKAAADIEQEHGGTLWEQPESYLDGAVVTHVPDIAASGLKGVAVVHGFDDGLVPYDQGRELATLLRVAGVPTDFFNAARRETNGTECGTDNTTLTENALGPIVSGVTGDCYTEPLAGHGTESSQTNIVIQTGLEVIFDLIDGTYAPANHEFVVDGEAGITQIV